MRGAVWSPWQVHHLRIWSFERRKHVWSLPSCLIPTPHQCHRARRTLVGPDPKFLIAGWTHPLLTDQLWLSYPLEHRLQAPVALHDWYVVAQVRDNVHIGEIARGRIPADTVVDVVDVPKANPDVFDVIVTASKTLFH